MFSHVMFQQDHFDTKMQITFDTAKKQFFIHTEKTTHILSKQAIIENCIFDSSYY